MTEEKIIMYDSPEAAQIKTLTGWVGDNRYWGADEHMARYCGCTHKKCECGNIMEKHYTHCKECRAKRSIERYSAMPFIEWDGKGALCFYDGDKYFFDVDDVFDYCEENEVKSEDLMLVICDENRLSYVNSDYWDDIAPEDSDGDFLPKNVEDALKALNEIISKSPAVSYSPGKFRTTVSVG